MFDKLSTVESRYDELMHRLGTGEVQSDPVEFRKAAKALSDMEPLVQKYREYKAVDQDIAGSEELVRGSDPEMRELAEEELKTPESPIPSRSPANAAALGSAVASTAASVAPIAPGSAQVPALRERRA